MRTGFILLTVLALTVGLGLFALPATAAPRAQQPQTTIRIDLVERSWVQLFVNNERIFEGTLEAGTSREWTGREIQLKVGNAGGVRVTRDGQSLGVLGNAGQVMTQRWVADQQSAAAITPTVVPQQPATATPAPATATPAPSSGGNEASPPATTPAASAGEPRPPSVYKVVAGDTILAIANQFGVEVATLIQVNNLGEEGKIRIDQQLLIPGSDGTLPENVEIPAPGPAVRGSLWDRQTISSRRAAPNSPFYRTTWVTYYGRPNVEIMGILGEFSIDDLVPKLVAQAAAYDEANGPEMGVMPAFHLVYGMATKAPGDDGTFLAFLSDETVMEYIDRAQKEGFGVILDIQIGSLQPAEALKRGLPFLKYDNVHLALDPEFAMSHPDQTRPGNPIGFVTAEQVNLAQSTMRDYMKAEKITGRRILIIHQFLDTMIVDKDKLARVYKIDLTLLADGWGGPWPKIGKYNQFMNEQQKFTGFKLFYRWDVPLMTEREVMGLDMHPDITYMDITPNLIIYQ
ncbi:MAG: DUF4115 domain-containing protein [Ardenticatenales bacterium]|nr:DUF4115 domain-containing protein [Ardenticatenales bacterium]